MTSKGRNMLRRINDALPGLVAGILIYGVVLQFTGVWFVDDKIRYSTGLWFGIAVAVGMAVNLAIVIFDSINFEDAKQAKHRVILKSALRYVIVVALFFIVGFFRLGNLIIAFLGVMGLKVSAYMQPLASKIYYKFTGRTDAASFGGENEEEILLDNEKLNKEVTL